jgi:hypothetical protein
VPMLLHADPCSSGSSGLEIVWLTFRYCDHANDLAAGSIPAALS